MDEAEKVSHNVSWILEPFEIVLELRVGEGGNRAADTRLSQDFLDLRDELRAWFVQE